MQRDHLQRHARVQAPGSITAEIIVVVERHAACACSAGRRTAAAAGSCGSPAGPHENPTKAVLRAYSLIVVASSFNVIS